MFWTVPLPIVLNSLVCFCVVQHRRNLCGLLLTEFIIVFISAFVSAWFCNISTWFCTVVILGKTVYNSSFLLLIHSFHLLRVILETYIAPLQMTTTLEIIVIDFRNLYSRPSWWPTIFKSIPNPTLVRVDIGHRCTYSLGIGTLSACDEFMFRSYINLVLHCNTAAVGLFVERGGETKAEDSRMG